MFQRFMVFCHTLALAKLYFDKGGVIELRYEGHKLRHEYKYYINESVYYTLRERFRYVLKMDENTKNEEGYLISSLYFDDINHSAMREKIDGSRFRKKFRIRIYDRSDSLIKLECKAKYDSLISKESATLTRQEYDRILNDDYDFLAQREERVCKELLGYHHTKLLSPVSVVEYVREAYVAEEGNVRITFDKNISTSIFGLDMFDEELALSEILPPGIMVLEVKYDDFIPKAVLGLLQIAMTEKCAISKYVLCRNKNARVRYNG